MEHVHATELAAAWWAAVAVRRKQCTRTLLARKLGLQSSPYDNAQPPQICSSAVQCLFPLTAGETNWNVEHRLQGQFDSQLNEAGIQQAQAVGALLIAPRKRLNL